MLISLNWLKQYITPPGSLEAMAVAKKLMMSTVEIEGMIEQSAGLANIVVGRILEVKKHPYADKLKVCVVDIGKEKLQVVCGGSNLQEGMLAAFAKIGAFVRWHGEGEPCEVKEIEIRGVKSYGMICASGEIGLDKLFPPKDEREILDLSDLKIKAGIPLAKALELDDVIFEIDNKSLSHRPDLWGHYGMAREVSALVNKKLLPYQSAPIKPGNDLTLEVTIKDRKLSPRYMAVAINGVKVGESPKWLKRALLSVGLRPINNIVDITNYVMADLGQPMHAFDSSKLKTQNSKFAIIVRQAKDGESLTTLDGEKKILNHSMLVIADAEKPIALAGVIGGQNSNIDDGTSAIIFESANFDAASIRKTTVKMGLRTESSARFEKSLDPNLCELALRKAVELTLKICPKARVTSKVIDKADFKLNLGPLKISFEVFNKKIGFEIPKKTVVRILKNLGFAIQVKGKNLFVKIPSWRATKDISIAEDLVEEVIRIYGFDKIPSTLPSFSIAPPKTNDLRRLERQLRDILVKELAYVETYNYSFVSLDQIKKRGDNPDLYLELNNPISKEKPFLRRSLLDNLLEDAVKNIEFFPELRLLEIGKVYLGETKGLRTQKNINRFLPQQDIWLATLFANKKDQEPFWQARKVFESLAGILHLPLELTPLKLCQSWQHPARAGSIVYKNQELGVVFEIHPRIQKACGLTVKAGVLEINLSRLVNFVSESWAEYKPLSIFPEIARDLAILVDKKVAHANLVREIFKISPLVRQVELFDFYKGDKIEKEFKSLAYHLVFRSDKRTLDSEEIDKIVKEIIKALEKKFGAKLRT